jgi:RND family efflux transporter MFP subunit
MPSLSRAAGASRIVLYITLSSSSLTACSEEQVVARPPQMVRAVKVELSDNVPTATLTGEIRPRVESVTAFRVGGRVARRSVELGDHVEAGDLLASLDPSELETGVASAAAAVDSAEAQHRQAASAFERQEALLASGFTTRRAYDQADEALKAARASLDGANAQLDTARDQLGHAELRAAVSGVVTARNIEVGQVVQTGQPAFTIAGDEGRDAVFSVNESVFARRPGERSIVVGLVGDPAVTATGTVREISPALSGTGTILVKVGLSDPPPSMELGASVSGVAKFRTEQVIALPWQTLTSAAGGPAVWVADPETMTVSIRPVSVGRYDAGKVVIHDGLTPGEIVVSAGAQLLRPGQVVEIAGRTGS